MKVYRLANGSYEKSAELSVESGDSLATSLLPGLSVTLASVFALP
jgi:hypothetical protein